MQSGSISRDHKIADLKKRMIASYGSSLLKVKIGRTLEALKTSDTPEQRARKIETNREIVAEREKQYKHHEGEMADELEKIIRRIETAPKPSRPEGIYALTESTPVISSTYCTECKNKDTNFFFSDPFSGDVICEGEASLLSCIIFVIS